MVQLLLDRCGKTIARRMLCIAVMCLLCAPVWAASKPSKTDAQPGARPRAAFAGRPQANLGAQLQHPARGEAKTRLLDQAGGRCRRRAGLQVPGQPYSITTDSHGRIIVTDPGAGGVHVFDFAQQKYKFLTRREKDKDATLRPQCVAVDDQDNIYVTDSEAGKVFVWDSSGKFKRAIGSLKGGEGFFKRPTGIAVDSAAQRIYVTDTLRNKIYVTDMQGSVLQTIGKAGTGDGEFNYPTELRLRGNDLVVVDAMNFRVQVLDRSGQFRYSIGKLGDGAGWMFRPKGIGFDSEGHLYVVDGAWDMVQVFNKQGQLLYYFGQKGNGPGNFQLPSRIADRQHRSHLRGGFLQSADTGFSLHRHGKPSREVAR